MIHFFAFSLVRILKFPDARNYYLNDIYSIARNRGTFKSSLCNVMISNLFISVIVSILSYNMNQLQGAIFSPRFFARRIKSSAKSFRLAAIFTASFREKKLPSHPRHCLLTKFIPMYLGSHSPARQTAEQTVGKDLPGRGWLEDGWRGF